MACKYNQFQVAKWFCMLNPFKYNIIDNYLCGNLIAVIHNKSETLCLLHALIHKGYKSAVFITII